MDIERQEMCKCMCVLPVYMSAPCVYSACRGQRGALGVLELEMVVSYRVGAKN